MSVCSPFATAFMCEMAQPHIDRSVQLTASISIKLSKLWNRAWAKFQTSSLISLCGN